MTDYAGAAACDTEAHAAWCRALLARGVYPPPSQFEAWFPSLAHTPEHVERTARGGGRRVRGGRVSALEALAATVRAGGGLLADTVTDPTQEGTLGALAGPGYAELVEAIYEGYLQHYGEGRVLRPADPDLALLAGDRLYALGLARLAELGDLEAVDVLAGVISRAAQAHAEGDPEAAKAAWEAGARAVGRAARESAS